MNNYLIHYGVQGQKWGKRNYQYEDGSLTPEGRIHYGIGATRYNRRKASNLAKYRKEKAIEYINDETKKKAEEIEKLEKDAARIAKRYNLDPVSGNPPMIRTHSDKELKTAKSKYLEKQLEAERIAEEAADRGWVRANKDLAQKYGDKSLDYVERYYKETAAMTVASILAIYGGLAYFATR